MPPPTPLPNSFTKRKALILAQLSIPPDQYDDLSPKGSIDEGIRELIDGINAKEGWVTTSSCAGRVSVFAEGERKKPVLRGWEEGEGRGEGNGGREEDGDGEQDGYEKRFEDEDTEGNEEEDEDEDSHVGGEEELVDAENGSKMKLAGAGGKGGGGRWLFVSHELVDIDGVKGKELSKFLGMQRTGEAMDAGRQFTEERLIHFKFEPMILHVLTASLSHAQTILKAALQAGFRESGALNLTSSSSEAPTPMVAVRSTGLALDCVIGRLDADGEGICIVSDTYLAGLLAVANDRFKENSGRIARFRDLLLGNVQIPPDIEARKKSKGSDWEDASIRRERKRAEGLKRSQELRERMTGDDT